MKEISFLVQGSAPEPYEVTFLKESSAKLLALCTCPAGENGQYCRHRLDILSGDKKGIVSDNADEVATVQEWLSGTALEHIVSEYRELDAKASEIKDALAKVKKSMARIMRNG